MDKPCKECERLKKTLGEWDVWGADTVEKHNTLVKRIWDATVEPLERQVFKLEAALKRLKTVAEESIDNFDSFLPSIWIEDIATEALKQQEEE